MHFKGNINIYIHIYYKTKTTEETPLSLCRTLSEPSTFAIISCTRNQIKQNSSPNLFSIKNTLPNNNNDPFQRKSIKITRTRPNPDQMMDLNQ